MIGYGRMHDGLYYLTGRGQKGNLETGLVASSSENAVHELQLQHRRLGHLSFFVLARLFPSLYNICDKHKLVCDACEFAKYTRTIYPISGTQSINIFDVIYSNVWGPCSTTSLSGHRYFVTFIDCHSRVT